MALLFLSLLLFWLLSHAPPPGWPAATPYVALALFTALWAYQVLVVLASLPRTALPPPADSWWRFFYADDTQDISFAFSHLIVVCAFSLGMGLNQEVAWPYTGAVLVGAVLPPAVKAVIQREPPRNPEGPARPCASAARAAKAAATAVVSSPVLVLMALLTLASVAAHLLRSGVEHVRMQRLRILDGRQATVHGVVVFLLSGLFLLAAWASPAEVTAFAAAVLALMALHTLALAGMLAEKVCRGRTEWQDGFGWLVVDWLGCFAIQMVPDTVSPRLVAVYMLWQAVLLAWSVAVNWARLVAFYRRWQQRHSRFVLDSREGSVVPVEDP